MEHALPPRPRSPGTGTSRVLCFAAVLATSGVLASAFVVAAESVWIGRGAPLSAAPMDDGSTAERFGGSPAEEGRPRWAIPEPLREKTASPRCRGCPAPG